MTTELERRANAYFRSRYWSTEQGGFDYLLKQEDIERIFMDGIRASERERLVESYINGHWKDAHDLPWVDATGVS